MKDDNYPEADENKTVPYKIQTSFHEHLQEQLGMLKLDEKQKKISEQIVGSIDDDGYLRRETAAIVDDLAFRQNIESNEAEVEAVISTDPAIRSSRCCARNLQECLLIQLQQA